MPEPARLPAITKIGIRTTDDGPFLPDVFWGIRAGAESPALVFPVELTAAMSSTNNAYFLLWEADTSLHI